MMSVRQAIEKIGAVAVVALFCSAHLSAANPFEPGWKLESEGSALRVTSVKKGSVIETSRFATYSGQIDAQGHAEVKVLLDSIDTQVDLRNVRMRFLFFETFKFPEAIIALTLDEATIADLPQVRRKVLTVPYDITIRGITRSLEAEIAVTLLSDDLVSVTSSTPITLALADFDLETGRKKLEEAAEVTIVPSATVTFDFLFSRMPANATGKTVAEAPAEIDMTKVALENQGNFTREECAGRFEILSRTGNIYFDAGSARLRSESRAVLDSISDILRRCPGLVVEISGHTDSDGSDATNQRLSEARARSVVSYFGDASVPPDRMVAVGYGEARPIADNASSEGKQRNRRIEFSLLQ